MTTNSGDLLCLIIDLNPFAWTLSSKPTPSTSSTTNDSTMMMNVDEEEEEPDSLSLEEALNSILIFCNSHLALLHSNELIVFAAGLGKSRLLYSSQLNSTQSEGSTTDETEASNNGSGSGGNSNAYQQFRLVDEKITKGIKQLMSELNDESKLAKVGLISALAMALCHINRISTSDPTTSMITTGSTTGTTKATPRILILSVTEDDSERYVQAMNSIFLAQKKSIPIDVCKIYGPDAIFLQQACFLTNGSYYKIKRRSGLLQYLMMAFLPSPSGRKQLQQPIQTGVDLRAACLCHKKMINLGFVCSVCLSIYCTPIPVCTTCRTKFPMSTLKRLGFGTAKPSNGAGGQQRVKKRKAVPAVVAAVGGTS